MEWGAILAAAGSAVGAFGGGGGGSSGPQAAVNEKVKNKNLLRGPKLTGKAAKELAGAAQAGAIDPMLILLAFIVLVIVAALALAL